MENEDNTQALWDYGRGVVAGLNAALALLEREDVNIETVISVLKTVVEAAETVNTGLVEELSKED